MIENMTYRGAHQALLRVRTQLAFRERLVAFLSFSLSVLGLILTTYWVDYTRFSFMPLVYFLAFAFCVALFLCFYLPMFTLLVKPLVVRRDKLETFLYRFLD